METIFNYLNEPKLDKNFWESILGVISLIITVYLPYLWGKRREKEKKVTEELPQILENYMKHIYNDLLKIHSNDKEEICEFLNKYIKNGDLYKISNPNLVNKFFRVNILMNNTEDEDYSERLKQEVKELFSSIEDYYWFLVEEIHSSAYKIYVKYEKGAFENMTSLLIVRNIKVFLDYMMTFNIILIIFLVYYVTLVLFKVIPPLADKVCYIIVIYYLIFNILYYLVNRFIILRYKSNLKAKRSISKTLGIVDLVNSFSSIYKELNSLTIEYKQITETNKNLYSKSIKLNESLKLLSEAKDSEEVQVLIKEQKEIEESIESMCNYEDIMFAELQGKYAKLESISKDIKNL